MIVALSFYGMSTFEGPMMSIKTVNALSHYTDWTIGHVHSGALGWVAMISIGSLYSLFPRLLGLDKMYSIRLIEWHFWTSTIGTVLYIVAMWIAGVMQGLMWRTFNDDGTLTYTFIEVLKLNRTVLSAASARRSHLPVRHVHHALQLLQDLATGSGGESPGSHHRTGPRLRRGASS